MTRATETAYSTIKAMILSGEVRSGAKLSEEALAVRCGVSRTPVREALRRLESELLIHRSETLRSFVADWSSGDVEDSFVLRGLLESHAARQAAQRIDAGQLAELTDLNNRIFAAVSPKSPDVSVFVEHNRAFHAIVLAAAGSARLANALSRIIEQPIVWRTAQRYGRDNLLRSYREHEELLAAFACRDGDWASSVMSAHIRRAFHTYADAHAEQAERNALPVSLSA